MEIMILGFLETDHVFFGYDFYFLDERLQFTRFKAKRKEWWLSFWLVTQSFK